MQKSTWAPGECLVYLEHQLNVISIQTARIKQQFNIIMFLKLVQYHHTGVATGLQAYKPVYKAQNQSKVMTIKKTGTTQAPVYIIQRLISKIVGSRLQHCESVTVLFEQL
jgi:hypothetical protein